MCLFFKFQRLKGLSKQTLKTNSIFFPKSNLPQNPLFKDYDKCQFPFHFTFFENIFSSSNFFQHAVKLQTKQSPKELWQTCTRIVRDREDAGFICYKIQLVIFYYLVYYTHM